MALENTLVPKNWRDRGGGFRQPQEVPTAPASADTGMRPVGFRNTGAIREQGERTAALAAGSAQVGEPTSFKAGAGAPEPIAVMRGTATTFSPGRLPGHQFAEPEMATPLQAQQAWNRGERGGFVATHPTRENLTYPPGTSPEEQATAKYGSFRETGQTGREIAAKAHVEASTGPYRGPLYEAQRLEQERLTGIAKTKDEKEARTKAATDFLHELIPQAGGVRVPKKNAVGYDLTWPSNPEAVEDINRAHDKFMETGDKAAAMKEFQESKQFRQFEPLFTPENITALKGTPGNQNNPDLSPEALALVQQHPQAKREYILKYGPQLAQLRPPQPPQSVGQRLMGFQETPGVAGP